MQSIKHDLDFHYTFHIDNNFFLANNIGLNTGFFRKLSMYKLRQLTHKPNKVRRTLCKVCE